MKINIFVQKFLHSLFYNYILTSGSPKKYWVVLVVTSTTDCSKEEGMCSLVDAVSLRCLDLSIRNRNMKAKQT